MKSVTVCFKIWAMCTHHEVRIFMRKRQMSSVLFGSFRKVQCVAPESDPLPGAQRAQPKQTHPGVTIIGWKVSNNSHDICLFL